MSPKEIQEQQAEMNLQNELENAEFAAYAEQANRDFEVINNRSYRREALA